MEGYGVSYISPRYLSSLMGSLFSPLLYIVFLISLNFSYLYLTLIIYIIYCSKFRIIMFAMSIIRQIHDKNLYSMLICYIMNVYCQICSVCLSTLLLIFIVLHVYNEDNHRANNVKYLYAFNTLYIWINFIFVCKICVRVCEKGWVFLWKSTKFRDSHV